MGGLSHDIYADPKKLALDTLKADLEGDLVYRAEAEAVRGVAMSDALHELKAELGRRPTLAEVRERADRIQEDWRWGIPLCSKRHPVKIRFVTAGGMRRG